MRASTFVLAGAGLMGFGMPVGKTTGPLDQLRMHRWLWPSVVHITKRFMAMAVGLSLKREQTATLPVCHGDRRLGRTREE